MGLEKSTYVSMNGAGRMEFKRDGDELRIETVNDEGDVTDAASLSEEDLRSLVKDFFPTKRGPKKAKTTNGVGTTRRGRQAEATTQ